METPKISIITPSYNQGDTISETIESVLAQGYPNFEHIVLDGGSTDQTVQVLKRYGHLKWESKPDRGQADALNRGLQMATGDIVTWLNSDDWYAKGVFHEVAAAIKEHPIVMGACELIDGAGKTMYVVENVERDWFDMLKYWIPYSIPAQPSIFMRRDLLQSVRREDGSLIDESFYYTMDYELWMRIASRCPFTKRIPRVISYYRMTENNKTSHDIEGMPYAEPEMSKVFLRSEVKRLPSTTGVSVCILGSNFSETLNSLADQTTHDFEVVVPVADSQEFRSVRKELNAWSQRMREDQRYFSATALLVESHSEFLAKAASLMNGRVVLIIGAGTTLESDAIQSLSNTFRNDCIGVAFPGQTWADEQGLLSSSEHQLRRVQGFLSESNAPLAFAFRRLALLEVGGIQNGFALTGALKATAAVIGLSGWRVSLDSDLKLSDVCSLGRSDCIVDVPAALGRLNELNQRSQFAGLKANFGFGIKLTPR